MLLWLASALLLALVALGLGLYYAARWLQAASKSEQPGREGLLELASKAATDRSGRALVSLLYALDQAGDERPIDVSWNRHAPANGRQGVLLKINWDGNEWRQIYQPDELHGLVSEHLRPDAPDGLAKQLQRDLEALKPAL